MSVKRLFIGTHPLLGTKGMWLSVPTVDVTTATLQSQFLLSPDYKNEQIIMTGSVALPSLGSATVFFPETLPSPPYIAYWSSESSTFIGFPYHRLVNYNGYAVDANVLLDRILFVNGTGANFTIFFHVLSRALGA